MKKYLLLLTLSFGLNFHVFPQCTATVAPSVDITSYRQDDDCKGKIITFTATPTNGGISPSYQWSREGYLIPGATNSTFQIPNTEYGMYYVIMTSSDVCADIPVCVSKNIEIHFRTLVTIASSCTGNEITFAATIHGNAGPDPLYEWFIEQVSQGPPTKNNSQFTSSTLVNNQEIYVKVTTDLECEDEKIISSNIIIYSDNTFEDVKITLYALLDCPELFAKVGATEENGGVYKKYFWKLNGQTVSTNNWIPTAYSNGDELQLFLETYDFCHNSTMASSNIMIFNDPCSLFSIFINGPDRIVVGDKNAIYSVPSQQGFAYTWSITGGTIVSGQNTNSVTVDWDVPAASAVSRIAAPAYSISVTETNTSNQKKTTTIDVSPTATSISKSLSQSGITLFPNPTSESFNIEMPESGVSVNYEVLNLTGTSVAQGNFISTSTAEKIITNFGAGMYQVVLRYNDVVTCGRLSKVQ